MPADLNNEQATKETFDDEGFVHTGDECKIDEYGLLYVVDRIKEFVDALSSPSFGNADSRLCRLIKSSGFQVAPAELEGHLLLLEDVLDVAIIGIPDERRGEVPKGASSSFFLSSFSRADAPSPTAFVVLTPPAFARLKAGKTSEEELSKTICKHVTDHKIKYKALHPVVEFLDAIPKTPSGKLLRKDRTSTFLSFSIPPSILTLSLHSGSTRTLRKEARDHEDETVDTVERSCRKGTGNV